MWDAIVGAATVVGAAVTWPKAIKIIREEIKRERPKPPSKPAK